MDRKVSGMVAREWWGGQFSVPFWRRWTTLSSWQDDQLSPGRGLSTPRGARERRKTKLRVFGIFSSLREHQDASTLRVGPRASTRRTVQALRAPRLPRDPIISFVVREVKLIE